MMTKDAFTKKYSVGDWVFNRFGEAAYYILKIGKNKVEYFHENSNSIAKPSFNNFYDHEDEILCNQPINEGLEPEMMIEPLLPSFNGEELMMEAKERGQEIELAATEGTAYMLGLFQIVEELRNEVKELKGTKRT